MKLFITSTTPLLAFVVVLVALLGCSKDALSPQADRASSRTPLDPADVNLAHEQTGNVLDAPTGVFSPPGQTEAPSKQIGTEPNLWFEWTELDMQGSSGFGTVTGTFPFKNPTSETRRLSAFRKSCECTKSKWMVGDQEYVVQDTTEGRNVPFKMNYEAGARVPERVDFITVGPGEEGIVTVEMELNGAPSKHASLGFSIDDPELPSVTIRFHARRVVYFTVNPEEVNLKRVRYDETRGFQIRVTSPVMPNFEILRHEAPLGVEVSYERTEEQGQTLYTIKGTYKPNAEAHGGGTLVFHTDRPNLTFDVRVLALVEGPVTATPQYLTLGLIRQGSSARKTSILAAGDSFDLQVTRLEPKDLSFDEGFLNAMWAKNDDGDVVITVEVTPGVPSGTVLSGELVVHLNHPAAESKSISLSGMVR